MKRFLTLTKVILTFLVFCRASSAGTVTLTAVADTTLYQNHPDANLGGTTLISGTNNQPSISRALFRFNLTGIPSNMIVTGAVLTMAAVKQPNGDFHDPVSANFSVYRVLVDWGEGTGAGVTGSTAQIGDATWNERHYEEVPWASPGGQFGADFASESSATAYITTLGNYTWGSSPNLVSDVQGWVNDSTTNFGFALVCDDESTNSTAVRFASRENSGGTASPGPQLTVTYRAPTATESWRQLYFGTVAGTGNAADLADPNENGIPNLVEYALNGDPVGGTTGTSILPQASVSGSNRMQLAFSRYQDRNDVTLTVQAADNPSGSWTNIAQSVNGGAFTVIATGATVSESGTGNARAVTIGDLYLVNDPAHPRRFMRLTISGQ